MPREGTGERRPWKVWDASRHRKRQVLAASLEELRDKGRERFGCAADEPVRLVLEGDGTYVDDSDYLNWLPDNTVFLLLRNGEHWTKQSSHRGGHDPAKEPQQPPPPPPPMAFRRCEPPPPLPTSSPIPRVVCDALNLLDIRHEPPFWKIIDNRGRITLVLHWEQPRNNHVRCVEPMRTYDASSMPTAMSSSSAAAKSFAELRIKSTPLGANGDVITVMSEDGKVVTTIRGDRIETPIYTQQIPKQHGAATNATKDAAKAAAKSHRGPAVKCPAPGHSHRADECEFHCGSLHEEGRSIHNAEPSGRSRAASHASPVQQTKSGHVRFSDQDRMDFCQRGERIGDGPRSGRYAHSSGASAAAAAAAAAADSSESEVEPESNTVEDECESGVTTEKMLLLTDQLTAEQRKHLTILDLGVILDRLKAKIIDVERLEREREGPTCFRWLIKATIRGRVLRDLGILYNGNYYSISEDSGLVFAASGFEDDEDREDPV